MEYVKIHIVTISFIFCSDSASAYPEPTRDIANGKIFNISIISAYLSSAFVIERFAVTSLYQGRSRAASRTGQKRPLKLPQLSLELLESM